MNEDLSGRRHRLRRASHIFSDLSALTRGALDLRSFIAGYLRSAEGIDVVVHRANGDTEYTRTRA